MAETPEILSIPKFAKWCDVQRPAIDHQIRWQNLNVVVDPVTDRRCIVLDELAKDYCKLHGKELPRVG